MKKITLCLFLILSASLANAQSVSGQVKVEILYSDLLENKGGENPERNIVVYLPPGYDYTEQRYPVIYFLHGFTGTASGEMEWGKWDQLLDQAISTKRIKPVILVIPNQHTLYQGSFYTNSDLTGNWADFTAKDLVSFIDSEFRTMPDRESRGIAGLSMGGHGAIKMGMLYPDVFSSVYALSPAMLGLVGDIGINANAYKKLASINTRQELTDGSNFMANAIVAAGRAFSPNLQKPPFYANLPYSYVEDSLVVSKETIALWNKNLPIEMINDNYENLKKLNALKLDGEGMMG